MRGSIKLRGGKSSAIRRKGIFLLLLCNASCRVGPDYQQPSIDTPQQWKHEVPVCRQEQEECLSLWWEAFCDDGLNDLERRALQRNQDIKMATWRLFAAKASIKSDRSLLFPQVAFEPSFSTSEQLVQFFNPDGVEKSLIHPEINQFDLPVTLNYEFDLWGKQQRAYQAALNSAQATEADLHSVLLSITSEVAQNYFFIRALDADMLLLELSLKVRQEHLQFQQNRYNSGYILEPEVKQASAEVYDTQAEIFDLKRERALRENTIALLIGEAAPGFYLESSPLACQPPEIPCVLPSEILSRRPDIAKAERDLAAQNERIGIAQAAFYPSINLSGIVGFSSPLIEKLGEWQSRFWLAGLQATQMIFDGGYRQANVNTEVGLYREALANYYQQILIAFKEVEDAMSSLHYLGQQSQALQKSCDANREAAELAELRFRQGFINYADVMDTEMRRLQAERSVTQIQGERFLATVQLMKALGGDFTLYPR